MPSSLIHDEGLQVGLRILSPPIGEESCLISELNIFVVLNASDQSKFKCEQLSFENWALISGHVCDGGSVRVALFVRFTGWNWRYYNFLWVFSPQEYWQVTTAFHSRSMSRFLRSSFPGHWRPSWKCILYTHIHTHVMIMMIYFQLTVQTSKWLLRSE